MGQSECSTMSSMYMARDVQRYTAEARKLEMAMHALRIRVVRHDLQRATAFPHLGIYGGNGASRRHRGPDDSAFGMLAHRRQSQRNG